MLVGLGVCLDIRPIPGVTTRRLLTTASGLDAAALRGRPDRVETGSSGTVPTPFNLR